MTPSITLLFDLSPLLEATMREWQEYSRVGRCYLPRVVYEEIEFLCDRASDPQFEQPAREFKRFYPQSQWQLTEVSATHPSLTPAENQTLSKTARLAIAILESAYGLAQEQPEQLVVFVSNSQPLLQRVQALQVQNLCGITATALLQWCRTQQRPLVVTRQLQLLIRSGIPPKSIPMPAKKTNQPVSSVSRATSSTPDKPPTPLRSQSVVPSSASRSAHNPMQKLFGGITQIIGVSFMIVVLLLAGMAVWRTTAPTSFDRFWKQQVAPLLR